MATNYDNIFKTMGIGGGIGTALGGAFNLFGPRGRSPSDAADEYYNKIPGALQGAFGDYINQGKGVSGATDVYKNMFSNPAEFYNQLGAGYKESPGYQRQLQQALKAGTNASAAGGMLGSPLHQQQAMETASDIANKDYQSYINNVMGVLGGGLSGAENTLNRGFNASKDLGEDTASVYGQQAANAYSGQAAENEGKSKAWGDIFSGVSSAIPWLFL